MTLRDVRHVRARSDEHLVAIASSARTPAALRELVRVYLVERAEHVIDGDSDEEVLDAAAKYLRGRIALADLVGPIARRRRRAWQP